MLKRKSNVKENILLLDANDFTSSYNSELLGVLEDCQQINFGTHLNFTTNIRFEGNGNNNRVVQAFNIYLQQLRREYSRIIINNI
jgi:hypothetical protein